ncbi:MAG TPA: RluA family pseudouridine synthase [Ktedonobacteraceae bacterium]|nr:RluA family pseudouridine synthase [Ktedonobacteraceae bacterium]
MPDTDSTPDSRRNWRVQSEQVGLRLDRYLVSTLGSLSRTAVQQLINDGSVLINGRASKPGYVLRTDDEIQVLCSTPSSQQKEVRPQALPLDIVYEDDDLLIVNKAAGMVVHPAPGHYDDTLVNALLARYPALQGSMAVEDDIRPGIVHRLDRDTSGLLIVAKNAHTQAALVRQMQRHEVVKRYLALVEGIVSLDQGSIDAPIGRNPRHRQQMAITSIDSREARTHFRVLRRFNHHTLLLLQLETGRTHQIRVHLQAIGHPVFGDSVYGPGHIPRGISLQRQFLHAYQLSFFHPRTGNIMEFEAPLPTDLQSVLDHEDLL